MTLPDHAPSTTGASQLQTMMEAARLTLPVHVEYDSDGGGEYGPYSRWAYRIPGVCNVAEEQDASWPNLVPDPEMGDYWATCPRSEYVAELLNAAPDLLSEVARLTAANQELAQRAEAGWSEEQARQQVRDFQELCGYLSRIADALGCANPQILAQIMELQAKLQRAEAMERVVEAVKDLIADDHMFPTSDDAAWGVVTAHWDQVIVALAALDRAATPAPGGTGR